MPVIYAASGNCHVYVDAAADLEQAEAIVLNAKTQRPGVCNAAETLLVHAEVAAGVPAARRCARCARAGVELRADERTLALAQRATARRRRAARARRARRTGRREYLALTLAVGVVDSVERGDRAHRRATAAGTPRRS